MAGQNGLSPASSGPGGGSVYTNGTVANNAGMNGGSGGAAVLPSAGQYADMQLLMQNMEALSGYMQQNREEWARVQEGLERVERMRGRVAREGGLGGVGNGEVQAPEPDPSAPTVGQLQNALAAATNRVTSMEKTYQDQIRIQHAYEESLAEATDRIRHFAFEQQNYISAMQQSYVNIINQHRAEIGEVQRTHHEWQASLGRLNENLRLSLKSREEEGMPWKRRIAALKSENALLRKKAGWDPAPETEDEDEGEEGEEGEMLGAQVRPQMSAEQRRALQVEREAVFNGLRDSQEKLRREGGGVGQQGAG